MFSSNAFLISTDLRIKSRNKKRTRSICPRNATNLCFCRFLYKRESRRKVAFSLNL